MLVSELCEVQEAGSMIGEGTWNNRFHDESMSLKDKIQR